jgi:hypothetical protein
VEHIERRAAVGQGVTRSVGQRRLYHRTARLQWLDSYQTVVIVSGVFAAYMFEGKIVKPPTSSCFVRPFFEAPAMVT